MKVSQMQYVRQTKEHLLEEVAKLDKMYSEATTIEQFMVAFEEHKQFQKEMRTHMTLASVRFAGNVNDPFYIAEAEYYDEAMPAVGAKMAQLSMHYLSSPLRAELEKILPSVVFTNLQMRVEASNPILVEDNIALNKINTEYTKLCSNLVFDFRGEKNTLATIAKYFADPDRATRKEAYTVFGQAIADNGDKFDEIFDRMVALRTSMAHKVGDSNFMHLAGLNMQRNCYTREDIAKFRANVAKYLVPLATKVKDKVAAEQGWESQHIYDSTVFTTVEPKPIGTVDEIFDNASKMYNEMSAHTGKLFDTMVADECFDVVAREGKRGGGFCTEIPNNGTPYIFSNFNGSQGDIDVLTHEFGHAFAASKSLEIPSAFLSRYSMETAEVHSMSMEFFAYPWIDKFFGEATDEYKFNHIAGGLTFIPYGTIVDYFQELVYTKPDMTPAERNATYNKLEKQFLPWCDTTGIPGLEDGRRWQRQLHIYGMPFYYIDYCLAQFTAFQFLSWSLSDYDKAFAGYVDFVSKGGTKTFTELVADSGLDSPFEEASFIKVVASIEKCLGL